MEWPISYVEIVDLNLRQYTHVVLRISVGPAEHCLLKYPVIRGRLAAVDITPYLDKFLLVDWKAQSSFVLNCGCV